MNSKETINLSPIERKLLFKEWCKQNGVKQFLFDGDDTLWGIVELFRNSMAECYRYLASCTSTPKEEWETKIQQINDKYFEIYGVNPERWEHVMNTLAEQNNLTDTVRLSSLSILGKIYQSPPRFSPDTEEALDFLKKTGVPIGVVTHANYEWTRKKFHWLSLSRFFNWEDIYIIDENGHKTEESWRQAIKYFGCQPNEVAVVGDSPRSDINPAQIAGVKHLFLFEPSTPIWSIHNQPIDPEVVRIKRISDLINLGQECLRSTITPSDMTGALLRGIFLSHSGA